MGKTFKWIGLIAILIVGANFMRVAIDKSKTALKSPDGKYDVIDGMVGKVAVDKFIEIKEERDTFNLPAFRTSLMMFQTQNGRFPRDIAEFENSGDASPDITRDHWGTPYQMKVIDHRTVILHGAGKDRIQGTTDDVEYTINL